jgi:predicted phosphodiesterase
MAEFKAEVISDTHLNLWDYTPEQIANIFPAKAPNLVLAGDIGDPDHASLFTAIKIACNKYKRVIYIPGNHEFYNRVPGTKKTPAAVLEWFRKLEEQFTNFHFFYRRTELYDGIRIIGATGWTTAPTGTEWANIISQEGRKDRDFLEQAINHSLEPTLVITHYPSTMQILQDSFKGKITEYNYAQNLEYMYRYPVNTWIFGHVHQKHDFTMPYSSSMINTGNIRIICNPYGYPNETPGARLPLYFTITHSSKSSVKSPDGMSYRTL